MKTEFKKLSHHFYTRENVIQISKDLLGKFLMTRIEGEIVTGGMIVETEAYAGATDRASHAYGNRRTNRTETMFAQGGISYVYLCYGIHNLFNIVTNQSEIPHAVLIRAIEPTIGIDLMIQRRKKKKLDFTLTSGPGSLSEALGITRNQNSISLLDDEIWVEDHGISFPENKIIASPRVGVGYAKEDALLPWRFRVKENSWTSKSK